MQRLVGPILHLKPGDGKTWRFTVGVWVKLDRGEPSTTRPTLRFEPRSRAVIDRATPSDAGNFHDGKWLYWNVSVPQGNSERELSYRIEGFADGDDEVDRLVIPALGQAPRIAFFSCNGVQDPRDWTTQPEMERLWREMLKRHRAAPKPDGSAGPYHVLVGGGDQLYCDGIWGEGSPLAPFNTWDKRREAKVSPALRRQIEAVYAGFYKRWRASFGADLMARVPGLYTWDDHDIFDGWGSYEDELQQCPLFEAIFTVAQKAFTLFQLGGDLTGGQTPCLDPQGGHFLQAVPFPGQLDLLLLDLRSQRSQGQVMGQTQWLALQKYLASRKAGASAAPHLLVVSSVPVVYLNFASVENVLDWLPWRQELEDDLADQWENPKHQEERGRLIMTLLDHAQETGSRVTILSGDVHVGTRGSITSQRPEHLLSRETAVVIHQLTSSAIVYPPPSGLELAGMQAVSHRGPSQIFGSSHVQTEVLAMSARHFLLGKNNWLSIEPDPEWISSRKQLWVRWVTEDGNVDPPLVIRTREIDPQRIGTPPVLPGA